MKILVTGGCGFIGSNLVRLLVQEKGESVINLDKLTYAGNRASLADLADHPDYHFEHCDLAAPIDASHPKSEIENQKSLKEIFDQHQPDAVIHLAAESHVDRSINGPGEFIRTNIVGTYNLLQASLAYWRSLQGAGGMEQGDSPTQVSGLRSHPSKESFRFLHVSTDEVYGSLASDAPGFSETTPYDPHSPYAASKAAADHLVRAWGDTYGLPVMVTNCSNNYGPYQFPEKLIPVVILKCLRGEPIPVYGNGENVRDWLYVGDHAEALHAVLANGRVGETYNIGGNNEQNNLNLVKKVCEIIGEELSRSVVSGASDKQTTTQPLDHSTSKSFEDLITFVTDRPGHDFRYAIDASKIKEELGWQPVTDFEQGLRDTVQWYLDNVDWSEGVDRQTHKWL